MARGVRKHLKRLNAPSHWMLGKLGGVWAPRPSTGPHKLRECLPLILILRNRLHLALTAHEVSLILRDRKVFVDGKVRCDAGYPVGFMDVLEIPEAQKLFRVLYDVKGRFTLIPIKKEESEYKLCRVKNLMKGKEGIPYIVTNDGRTIRFPHPSIKINDTVKLNLKTGKVDSFIGLNVNTMAYVTGGSNCGRIGSITRIEKHAGSYTMVHLTDKEGNQFITRIDNVFAIGESGSPLVTIPHIEGVRPDIIKNRELRLRAVSKRKEE